MRYVRMALIFLVVLACGGAIYLAYNYLSEVQKNRYKTEDVLPGNVILVYQSDKMMDDWRKLNGTSVLWEQTKVNQVFPEAQSQLSFMDSILIQDPKLEQFLNQHTATFSVHYFDQKIEQLFSMELLVNDDKDQLISDLLKVMPDSYKTEKKTISNQEFTAVKTGSEIWYLGFNHNILLLSKSTSLIEKTFKAPEKNKVLAKLVNMRGTGFDVQGNLYLNYPLLHLFLKNNLAASPFNNLGIKGWSLSDVNVGPQSIQLSGLFKSEDNEALQSTQNLPDREMFIHHSLPSNIASFIRLSLPDRESKPEVLKISKQTQENFEQAILDSDLRLNSDIGHQLFAWMGNEAAVAWDEAHNKFLVFSTDPSMSRIDDLIQSYASASLKYESRDEDTSNYRDFHICNASLQVQYSAFAGDLFEMPEQVWFASNQENVIVAESKESLKKFIRDSKNKRFSDVYFEEIESLLASKSFGFLYLNPSSTSLFDAFLSEKQLESLKGIGGFMNEIGFVGVQLGKANNSISLNAIVSSKQNLVADNADLWELELPATADRKIDLIFNHRSKTYNYLVQDTSNMLHLISNTGQLVWSRQLDGPYLGRVRQIDIYDNKKLQMVMNTASSIYVIDILGRDVKHFPVDLPSSASAPIAIFDYENKHDYRLIVPSGRQLLNYNTDGEQVSGWKFEEANDRITISPIHEVIEGKDFILFPDESGKVYVLNRQGKEAELEDPIENQLKAFGGKSFYIEKSSSLSTSKMIYLDTNNTVYMQYFGGQTDSIPTLGEGKDFTLEFEDVDGDNFKDYVVYGDGRILAFRKDKQKLFAINNSQCDQSFAHKFKSHWILALYDSDNQEMYLYNKNGELLNEDPLSSTPALLRGDFNDDGELELIYGTPLKGLKCSYPR